MIDQVWRPECRHREGATEEIRNIVKLLPQKRRLNEFYEETKSRSKQSTCAPADECVLWMATPEAGDSLVDDPIDYWHQRRTWFRNKLDVIVVAICMALRSWYRTGLVSIINPLFLSIAEDIKRQKFAQLSEGEAVQRVTSWLNRYEAD
ncbi:hypothetical protein F5Y14DRAFT_40307 [Nemania sp. NC0429]|nr:hypothetical protein F5Y14DRAFT_40307 [Nemania sp. NC0429]